MIQKLRVMLQFIRKVFMYANPILAVGHMSNDMVKFGGIGAILCMLSAIAEIVAVTMLWLSSIDYVYAGTHIDFGAGIVMAVGVALLSIGAFGLFKQYNTPSLRKVGMFGFVAMVVGLVASVIVWQDGYAITSVSLIFQGASLTGLIGVAGIVWLEIMGLFMILFGYTLYQLQEKTGVKQLTNAAGILTMITGAVFCSIIPFGYLYGQVPFLLSTILVAYVMFKAR